MAARDEVIYRIDRDGLLTDFNPQWDRFAAANGSPELSRRKIRRRLLWSFIQDPETRHAHHTLIDRARARRGLIDLPFRCDSPALRRYMEMDILPLDDGGIEYRCRTLRTETRPAMPLDARATEASAAFVRMCSWCKQVDLGGDRWVEIEEAVGPLGLLSRERFPSVTHTICGQCLKKLEEEELGNG